MKKTVGIIFGGKSVEHEVSVITAHQIMENIDKDRFDVLPIYISKSGKWYTGESLLEFENFKNKNLKDLKEIILTPVDKDYYIYSHPNTIGAFKKKFVEKVDVIFPAIHGTNGEDGTLQGFLELLNIPYVGGGVLSSSVGMDKILMKDVFKANNLPVVDYVWFYRSRWNSEKDRLLDEIEESLGYPVFVKPANLGSSVGISKAGDRKDLSNAIEIAIRYDRKIIVEKAVQNPREINCAVMGYDDNVEVSLCEEPVGWEDLLTYEDKYINSNVKGKGEKRRIPADIPENTRLEIEKIAKNAFIAIDGSGNSRIDFLVSEDNKVYINEINTMPGSIAYYLWEGKDISFKELITKMIDLAFIVYEEKDDNMYSYDVDLLNKVQYGNGSKTQKI